MVSLSPRCPHCGALTREHCPGNDNRCGWRVCLNTTTCGSFGDPAKRRWTPPKV